MSEHHVTAQMAVSILVIVLRAWGVFGLPIARRLVTTWVSIYTHPASPTLRVERRMEIASDVAEQEMALRAEGYHPSQIGAYVLIRMVAGIPADLAWMVSHLEVIDKIRHSRIVVGLTLGALNISTPLLERPWPLSLVRSELIARWLMTSQLTLVVTLLKHHLHRAEITEARLLEIESVLASGWVWPEDRHELEAEAHRLRVRQKDRAWADRAIRGLEAARSYWQPQVKRMID